MINHILIILQVEIINFKLKSTYNLIPSMNQLKITTYNFHMMINQTCTAAFQEQNKFNS